MNQINLRALLAASVGLVVAACSSTPEPPKPTANAGAIDSGAASDTGAADAAPPSDAAACVPLGALCSPLGAQCCDGLICAGGIVIGGSDSDAGAPPPPRCSKP